MSAELQTISAAFELIKLARAGVLFLKKVANADKAVSEVYNRIVRLRQVLRGVEVVLAVREERDVTPTDPDELETVDRICAAVASCITILKDIEERVGGFDLADEPTGIDKRGQETTKVGLLDRVSFVFRESGTRKRQADLEAGISTLQTDLALLQLWDLRQSHLMLGSNQHELLTTLNLLGERIAEGNDLVRRLTAEHGTVSDVGRAGPILVDADQDQDAISSLTNELRIASSIHEKFTSEYQPDDRSVRFNRGMDPVPIVSPPRDLLDRSSRRDSVDPRSTTAPPSLTSTIDPGNIDGAETVSPLLEMMDRHIDSYIERSRRERDAEHFNQAEINLQTAIKYSVLREQKYNVPFQARQELQEEVAFLYQKQCKWAEAVRIVSGLLREGGDDQAIARQNQLLASIYHDRHLQQPGSLAHTTKDIENAEKHALQAFNKYHLMPLASESSDEELEQHTACITLLVRILELQNKDVEANDYRGLIAETDSSVIESVRRRSTLSSTRPAHNTIGGEATPVHPHQSLISAIKESDLERIQAILSDKEVDVDRACSQGKTPLIHAVEHSDESTVHKLLDPEVGADINAKARRGITALHRAAELGLHEMVRCLLEHDAEIEAKDNHGETALMKAVRKDQRIVIQVLYERDANMYTKNAEEWSPLHYSIHHNGVESTDLLLELAPELRHAVDTAGKTALHHCAERVFVDQAKALVTHRHPADVNALDSVLRSPLYLAASHPPTHRREHLVRLLIDHGAQLDDARLPPRYQDYALLAPHRRSRRPLVRRDSVSTSGSVGTTSTGKTMLSRIFSSRMQIK